MSRSGLRYLALSVGALVALLLVLAPGASAADRVVERSIGAHSSRAALDYWTPERMRAATPLAVPEPAASPALDAAALRQAPTPRALPSSGIDLSSTIQPRAPRRGPAKIGIGDRPPFTAGQVPPEIQTTFPTSTNGKVFGELRGIGQYSCSATVVASGSQSVILTAGHCVHDFNAGFARRVIFVPAYRDGEDPFGVWTARSLIATKQWQRAVNYNYDYAAIRLRPAQGAPVGAVVGEQGVAFNQAREQDFQAIGYPFNRAKSELMWNCVAPFAGIDPRDRNSGPPDSAMGCDMSSGSSGGGWFIRDAAGAQYLNSVTSFGYRMIKKTLFGPYFTRRVLDVIAQADR